MEKHSATTTKRWPLLLLAICCAVAAVAVAAGCEAGRGQTTSGAAEEDVHAPGLGNYELAVHFIDYAGMHTFLVNGFPVERFPVMGRTADQLTGSGLNTALVGEGNVASVQVEPYLDRAGGSLSVGPVEMRAWVQRDEGNRRLPGTDISEVEVDSAYARWTERARAKWQGYLAAEREAGGASFALDSLRAWAARRPLTVSTTFDNRSGPDFSSVFGEEAPRVEGTRTDSARLKDYAIRLRDLFASKNAEALYEEVATRLGANGGTREEGIVTLRENWLALDDWRLDFSREDVRLKKWSEGRVWQLYREGNGKQALFEAGDERLTGFLKVYVGERDGKLRVVR